MLYLHYIYIYINIYKSLSLYIYIYNIVPTPDSAAVDEPFRTLRRRLVTIPTYDDDNDDADRMVRQSYILSLLL